MTTAGSDQRPGGARAALITGITGQDGSYLTELLVGKGYDVHGIVRRASLFNTARVDHLYRDPHDPRPAGGGVGRMTLHYGDMTDANSLARVLRAAQPDEVYNLAAQSHVRVSFDQPIYTAEVVATGALKLLEAVREHQRETGRRVRFFQASSSEQFGGMGEGAAGLTEGSAFHPRSPYACAKVMAHHAAVNYRESYAMFVCCGIMFNHESPRRGDTFVTRKISRAVGRIKMGLQQKVYLGNLEARRDWGFAGDYVQAMWRMVRRDEPADYVIATGRSVSVKEFARLAFARAGLNAEDHVEIDPRYFRPAEVPVLLGDASKARRELAWTPTVGLEDLVRMMVDADMNLAARERTLRDAGYAT